MMENNFDFAHPKDRAALNNAAHKNFVCSDALQVHSYENAIVGSGWDEGGVWQENGQFLTHTFFNSSPLFPMNQKPTPHVTREESVVFVGLFTGTWGHEITDHLKHLWFYFDERYAHLNHLRWVYACVFGNTQVSSNYFALLKSIGIDPAKLERITGATQFARVFVPDDCFFHDKTRQQHCFTPEYAAMINRIPQLPPPPKNNIKKFIFHAPNLNPPTALKITTNKPLKTFLKIKGLALFTPKNSPF